ncbi:MAG: hypothetical protein NTX86_00600 [Candidatus Dependentiae bacterium]|nr:hypothetical protein [Candidatus Dependentiae bacterium]
MKCVNRLFIIFNVIGVLSLWSVALEGMEKTTQESEIISTVAIVSVVTSVGCVLCNELRYQVAQYFVNKLEREILAVNDDNANYNPCDISLWITKQKKLASLTADARDLKDYALITRLMSVFLR